MSADSIVYCLERVSDYRDFERLCSALLAGAGYPAIDPLGGTGDEGRDAVIRSDDQPKVVYPCRILRLLAQVEQTSA